MTDAFRLGDPERKVGHAELHIGGTTLMLSDEYADYGALSPPTVGGTPVTFYLYCDDVDAVFARAVDVDVDATVLQPVADAFYGDRTGQFVGPFGHKWCVATQGEPVAPEDMQRLWDEAMAG